MPEMQSYRDIIVSCQGRAATITLNLPQHGNAISDLQTVEEIEKAITGLQRSHEFSVLILTGSGSIFSAGGNIKAMRQRSGMFAGPPHVLFESYQQAVQRITRLFASLELVTIAAVNGAAIGAGCDLALMCDLRLAARSARFGQAFVNLGIIPGDGGTWFLTRLVPRHVAADLIFTGRNLTAEEAWHLGLINEMVEDDQLMLRAAALAAEIAAKPPLALRLSKRLLDHAYHDALPDFLDRCAAYQSMLHPTQDHHEALEAFFEKRAGRYEGK